MNAVFLLNNPCHTSHSDEPLSHHANSPSDIYFDFAFVDVVVVVVSVCVAVEVRKRTLYRKLILRKWRLKFSNDFDVIIDVVLDCLLYACKTFNGHSACLCFMCV